MDDADTNLELVSDCEALASLSNPQSPLAAEETVPTATITPVRKAMFPSTPTPVVPTALSDLNSAEAQPSRLFVEVEGEPSPSTEVEALASRLVGIDFGKLARVIESPVGLKDTASGKPQAPQRLVLNLFDGVVLTGIVEHVESTASGHALWGRIEDVELGTMTLVVNGNVVVGTVRTPNAVYTIRSADNGAYVIRQIDESSLPPLGEPLGLPLPASGAIARTTDNSSDDYSFALDDGSVIDVMVVYTPLAKYGEGGRAHIEALIDLFVAETNQAFENSGVIHRIRLVLREEVDYTETGETGVDLGRLISATDGYMDHVPELRDVYAADLVHFVIGGSADSCGLGWRSDNEEYAFALTVRYCEALTFAHELGHNLNLDHDRYVIETPGRKSNYGYVNQRAFEPGAPESARWSTIMSYPNQCGEVGGFDCPAVLYFSNPELTYNGDPMGVPADHPSSGVDGPADASGTLNDRRKISANYRRSSTSSTGRVGLALSQYWLSEDGGVSTVKATVPRPSTADTVVTVSASPSEVVTMSANRTLTIPAGQTTSVGALTITSIDNGEQTGDVIVTISAVATNSSSQGVLGPEPVQLAIADDETTPIVSLSLSRTEVLEGGERGLNSSLVTATLDNRSGAETMITVSASPVEAVYEIWPNPLRILAGQKTSGQLASIYAVDDTVSRGSKKIVTVSGMATNPQGVIGPESATLTIIDDDAPIFPERSISLTFTAEVSASRVLPEAVYGNGRLTYSISPALSNGMTFAPGPPARIGVSTTSLPSETSYTLSATDADGDIDTMTVNITVRDGVCPNSVAVSEYGNPGIVADCEALLASRDLLRGEQSLNWSEDLFIDNWQGIEIGHDRVVGIDLPSLELSGTIPPELGNLSQLRRLALILNKLSGPIPPEVGNLAVLQLLDLRWNQLAGEIPPELGSLNNLQRLYLGDNKLSGSIPPELGSLANLEELFLSHNRLTGEIPPELSNLANVRSLGLGSSQLTGPIPVWLGGLANLQSLELSWNRLSGPIPPELSALANLEWLGLNNNRLTGEIPASLGGLANLEGLRLSNNQLTGKIPTELHNLHNLQIIDLRENRLTGEIPTDLGSLVNLQELFFHSNDLTGEIPPELGGLAKLQKLYLSDNQLTGEIPPELGGLAELQELYLSVNHLTGRIPPELGNLANLQALLLAGNQLTGCIPWELRELRDVAGNDLHLLDLPFCDVLLSGLAISPGSLVPSFDPYHAEYTVAVGRSQVTAVPANDRNASILFLDQNDVAIADADFELPGHQVDFSSDLPAIKIRVVSEDGLASHTYTIADLGIRYDANENGVIDRDEVIASIVDYFDDRITRDETIAVIKLYFSR